MNWFDDMEITQSTLDGPGLSDEEMAEMDAGYPVICSCGADLEDAPLPGCEMPCAHGDDVYK